MIVQTLACTQCHKPEAVVKHRTNRSGTARCRCLTCKKTVTPNPTLRRVDPKVEQIIGRALEERIAYNTINLTFRVGWDTIARIAKKVRSTPKAARTTAFSPARRGRNGAKQVEPVGEAKQSTSREEALSHA